MSKLDEVPMHLPSSKAFAKRNLGLINTHPSVVSVCHACKGRFAAPAAFTRSSLLDASDGCAMNKRVARLRREYLYRKSLQGAQAEEYEKKRAIRDALQEGKPLPTELRKEANELKKQVDLEDDNTAVQRTNVDDEYGNLGVVDPQVGCASQPQQQICSSAQGSARRPPSLSIVVLAQTVANIIWLYQSQHTAVAAALTPSAASVHSRAFK